jgi:uncharacterized protein YutE (UPF0331/DUF86 family)
MKLNEDLIRTRCEEIEESLARLQRISATPKETFLADQDLKDIACYRLLVAIEAALALCYHVSSRHLRKVPDDYAGCFALLGEAGIISEGLSGNLQKMSRFRNLLVHMYWKIDYEKVFELISQDLGDLRRFANTIAALS